jgi:hypothetical protein
MRVWSRGYERSVDSLVFVNRLDLLIEINAPAAGLEKLRAIRASGRSKEYCDGGGL